MQRESRLSKVERSWNLRYFWYYGAGLVRTVAERVRKRVVVKNCILKVVLDFELFGSGGVE